MSIAGHRRRQPTDLLAGPADAEAPVSSPPADPETPAEPTTTDSTTATEPAASGATRTRRRRKRSFWRELPILVVIALILAVLIKTYAIQAFFIPSGSMENTLDINDRVLINKLVYDFRSIHRGDIVVFNGDGTWNPGTIPGNSNFFAEFADGFASMFGFGHASDIYVKRVIGLPGDHVACCDAQGRVTVNNIPLDESSYLYPGDAPSEVRFNIIVPAGHIWVMGDHRSVSEDSRYHLGSPGGGAIPESAVLGRAFVIIWPPSRWRFLPIPATFDQPSLNGRKSQDAAAALVGARLEPEGPAVPLALGFAAAVPLTLLTRLRARARSLAGSGPAVRSEPSGARMVTNWRTLRLK
jgi:signal peptidase I